MFILIFLLLGVLITFFLVFFYTQKKNIDPNQLKEFENIIKKMSIISSPKESIIDFDKLYHKMLLAYGYTGSFGDILKQKPIVIRDVQAIWELHKLRNKLAHDFDIIDDALLYRKSQEYLKEVEQLFLRISK